MSDANVQLWEIEVTEEEFQRGNQEVINEFRANGGKVGGPYESSNLLLLTTTGARSGKRHTVPLAYFDEGERILISSLVDMKYPSWLYNLRANPIVTIEIGTETVEATASEATGDEYAHLWEWVKPLSPWIAEHQKTTKLTIPLVLLQR